MSDVSRQGRAMLHATLDHVIDRLEVSNLGRQQILSMLHHLIATGEVEEPADSGACPRDPRCVKERRHRGRCWAPSDEARRAADRAAGRGGGGQLAVDDRVRHRQYPHMVGRIDRIERPEPYAGVIWDLGTCSEVDLCDLAPAGPGGSGG
jgi:hypothetical protein